MAKKLSFFPYVGGKHFMLNTLLKIIPPHRIYVEVFGGSGKLLLNKEPSKLEIYNDYDKRLANLFYVIVFKFDEFYEKVSRLVYSREIYNQIVKDLDNVEIKELGDVNIAVKTYFKLQSSFSGRLNSKVFKITLTERFPKEFFNSLNKLSLIHDRLKNVIIENMDFKKLLKKYKDIEDAFIYLDPPYYGVSNYYNIKFTEENHKEMLNLLKETKAKWLLSGYSNELYNIELKDFYRVEIPLKKHSYALTKNTKHKGNTKPIGIEVLWANYPINL